MLLVKPTDPKPNWSPIEANVDAPSPGKQAQGFIFQEILGSKRNNWFWKRVSQWLAYTGDLIEALHTTEDLTFEVNTENDFDELLDFFRVVKGVNHGLTITGDYGNTFVNRYLDLDGLFGTGSITWSGARHIRGIRLSGVGIPVSLGTGSTLTMQDTGGACISLRGSKLEMLNSLTIEAAAGSTPAVNWVTVDETSALTLWNTTFNKNVTGDYSMIYNMGHLSLAGTVFNATSVNNRAAIWNRGTMVMLSPIGTVSTNHRMPIRSAVIPKGFDATFTFTSASNTEFNAVLDDLSMVNSDTTISFASADFDGRTRTVKNVGGSGSITIHQYEGNQASSLIFEDCPVTIKLTGTSALKNLSTGGINDACLGFFRCGSIIQEDPHTVSFDIRTSHTAGKKLFVIEHCGYVKLNQLIVESTNTYVSPDDSNAIKYFHIIGANSHIGRFNRVFDTTDQTYIGRFDHGYTVLELRAFRTGTGALLTTQRINNLCYREDATGQAAMTNLINVTLPVI